MNEHQLQILSEAKKNILNIFTTKINPLFVFHNLHHTEQVVSAAEEIGEFYQLDDNDQFVLFISAWFHDSGFSSGHIQEHEKESVKLVSDFLQYQKTGQKIIAKVSSCIQATRLPQAPINLVEKIICDADLYHLGTKNFSIMNACLKQELQNYYKINLSDEEWYQDNIEFLRLHQYFTGYCREKLEPIKQEWIEQMINEKKVIA